MRAAIRVAVVCLTLAVAIGTAAGELIPTPEFSHHPIPTTQVPGSEAAFWDYLDVVVLLTALSSRPLWTSHACMEACSATRPSGVVTLTMATAKRSH